MVGRDARQGARSIHCVSPLAVAPRVQNGSGLRHFALSLIGLWIISGFKGFAREEKDGCTDSHRDYRRLRAGVSFAFRNQRGALRRRNEAESSTGSAMAANTFAGRAGRRKNSAALGRTDCFTRKPLQELPRDAARN